MKKTIRDVIARETRASRRARTAAWRGLNEMDCVRNISQTEEEANNLLSGFKETSENDLDNGSLGLILDNWAKSSYWR